MCDTRTDCEKYEGIDENGCYDFTKDAKTFLKAVSVFNSAKFGLGIYILFLRGSNSSKLHERERKHEFFGSGKNRSEAWWQAIGKPCITNYIFSQLLPHNSFKIHGNFSNVTIVILF